MLFLPKLISLVKLLYHLFTRLYPFAIRSVSPFNPKAKLWIKGRSNVFDEISAKRAPSDKYIWMHCASLGEFEQGRPLLEQLRILYPAYKIILTFFSPSGYEIQKEYPGADIVCYLPMDGARNASRFYDLVKPELVLFVKYEFWYNYYKQALSRNIPLLLVSGIFRKDQPFFSWYGSLHRSMLKAISHFFLQNRESAELLRSIGIQQNVTVNGDTRFDRVMQIARSFTEVPKIAAFCGNSPVIVAGSTWPDDDEELDHFANSHPEIRFIIAPHDIGADRISDCMKLYKNAITYSQLNEANIPAGKNTLVIDNIGMLSRLYRYGTICYVGGGFGDDGIHNILEAAVFGKPVVFGPEYEKFYEATELVALGGAFSVTSAIELEKLLSKLLQQDDLYSKAAETSASYVAGKKGPTEAITIYIQENRLLIS